MRHGGTRERLRKELDVLCFEMEAAGLMDEFPCLVVRGTCDYAGSVCISRQDGQALGPSDGSGRRIPFGFLLIIGRYVLLSGADQLGGIASWATLDR
jgi:hypothetical protein